jgi:rSAM/selenodomain-associated transferase 1
MRQLGMFAKYWQPGAVKTRLAAGIGDEPASEIYRCFLRTLVRRLQAAADRRVIVYAPRTRRGEFASLAGDQWALEPQATGDLGRRMSQFFDSALARDKGSIVLIGSDSPTLPIQYVEQAFDLLREFPVVLGPSRDGGYYLIGAARHIPCVFTDIAWSSSRVWEQTVARLRHQGSRFATLPSWYDVDDLNGLGVLRAELHQEFVRDESLCELRQSIERLLPDLESESGKGS